MGLCFNNEIYYQLGKGLIHQEVLEMISNNNMLGGALIAPSMYIKQIIDSDSDYKYYLEQIFSNINETHSSNTKAFPKDLNNFFESNNLNVLSYKNEVSKFILTKFV